jgi:hypothetical protein
MKRALVVAGALLFSPLALAQQPSQGGGHEANIQDMKQKVSARIQERINRLQTAQQCVQQAQDREQLRACMPRQEHQQH